MNPNIQEILLKNYEYHFQYITYCQQKLTGNRIYKNRILYIQYVKVIENYVLYTLAN